MKKLLFSGLAVLAATSAALLIYLFITRPPSDAVLKVEFAKNQPVLEEIVRMAEQDRHLVRIAPDFTWLDSDAAWPRSNVGLSTARWNQYRELFGRAELPAGIGMDTGGIIYFPVYVSGIAPASFEKGFVYSKKPLPSASKSLKRFLKGWTFEPIATNWYIYSFDY